MTDEPWPRWPAQPDLDLGDGHVATWFSWRPDDLPANRARYGFPLPSVDRAGVSIYHKRKDGANCVGAVTFDLPALRAAGKGAGHVWQVQSFDPLTISPSVLCKLCGDHGFIRNGKWVRA